MTSIALDYQSPSAMDGARCQAAGIKGVLRYLYNLNPAELKDLWDHGIAVSPIFEHLQTDYLGGYAAGLTNGRVARSQARNLGFPDWVWVWCAVDTRLITSAKITLALDYFRGFFDGCGASRPYGEGAFIDACVDAGLSDLGWCPETWDNTDSPHLALIQLVNTPNPYPSTDQNRILVPNWGGYLPGDGDMTKDELVAALNDAADPLNQALVNLIGSVTKNEVHALLASDGAAGGGDPTHNGVNAARDAVIAEVHKVTSGGNAGAGGPLKVTLTGTAVPG